MDKGRLQSSNKCRDFFFDWCQLSRLRTAGQLLRYAFGELERSVMFRWETINNFGSLRERDRFLIWLQAQIATGGGVRQAPR
jgi:hypothetical protein